jgi:hypothetical protein
MYYIKFFRAKIGSNGFSIKASASLNATTGQISMKA